MDVNNEVNHVLVSNYCHSMPRFVMGFIQVLARVYQRIFENVHNHYSVVVVKPLQSF